MSTRQLYIAVQIAQAGRDINLKARRLYEVAAVQSEPEPVPARHIHVHFGRGSRIL